MNTTAPAEKPKKASLSPEYGAGIERVGTDVETATGASKTVEINASGHVQELERNFGLFSVCAVGIVTGNTWAALGGSITVAIYDGGPAGVIYEFITVSIFYWLIAACIAELASAVPSSGGVYHWASITGGPRYGRICGWFAGFWNLSAWLFGTSSLSAILGNQAVQMYALFHPSFVPEKWHVFIAYVIATWCCCCVVLFANRALPSINNLGLVFILGGVFVTIVACAVLPGTDGGNGHASTEFVWREWQNGVGYQSDGFVFLLGMLNGAFAVGTPDCVSHLAEEIPNPERNIPRAMAAQMSIGLFSALCYLISIFYSISDLDAVLSTTGAFPLAAIYHQAAHTRAGALGLILMIFLPTVSTVIGSYITVGRTLWTLARDEALPFSNTLSKIHPRHKNPFRATLLCGVLVTLLGCIYVGSSTAFNAFVGSYVVLSTLSYLAALLPHLLFKRRYILALGTGRDKGGFWMPEKVGLAVLTVSCSYIVVFVVVYCFPYQMPVTVQNMNYTCVTVGGMTVFYAAWWFYRGRRGYEGPKALVGPGEGVVVPMQELVKEVKN